MRYLYLILFLFVSVLINAQNGDDLGSLLDQLREVPTNTQRVDLLNQIAWEYRNSNPRLGISYGKQALVLGEELQYQKGIGISLSYIGVNHKNLGEYAQALEFFLSCLQHSQGQGDVVTEGHSYNSIGEIYRIQKKYEQAEQYFRQALAKGQESRDPALEAYAYHSFGKLYKDLKKYELSLEQYQRGLELRKQLKDKKAVAASIESMSKVYEAQGKLDLAINTYYQAFDFAKGFQDARGMATALLGIARIQLQAGRLNEALVIAQEALQNAEKVGDKLYIQETYEVLSEIAKAMRQFEAAMSYQDKHLAYRDSLYNEETTRNLQYLTKSFQEEQDRANIALLKEQQKNTQTITFFIGIGLLISVIFSVFVLRGNRQLVKMQNTLQESFELLEKKNQDIEASIRYASRIQKSMLPDLDDFKSAFQDSFVFYKPKNVIGGDFYFYKDIGQKAFFAVADCTGHGVPGALLSIVGNMALQKAIVDMQVREVDKILVEVHREMRRMLRQSDQNASNGMEIALCSFHKSSRQLEVASARNPVYVFQGEEMSVIEGDRYTIGDMHAEELRFTKHSYHLASDSLLYLASDGLQDQFGGEGNKKFSKKGLREMLQRIHNSPSLDTQLQDLEVSLREWQGQQKQTDDILIMGVKIA
jgi:serine phosphatase RsbU (regulator of sigma subunit)/Tfp pilus assembly protein PilF